LSQITAEKLVLALAKKVDELEIFFCEEEGARRFRKHQRLENRAQVLVFNPTLKLPTLPNEIFLLQPFLSLPVDYIKKYYIGGLPIFCL